MSPLSCSFSCRSLQVFTYPDSANLLIDNIPGAKGQPHTHFTAGHLCQEDAGPVLAKAVIDFVNASPSQPPTAKQARL